MHVKVDPENVQTVRTDDRGRAYLGTQFAGETVVVAVVEVRDDDDE